MTRMVALKKIYYPRGAGRDIFPGDEFDALSDRDATALAKIGQARLVDQPGYKTTEMKSESQKPQAQSVSAIDAPAAESPTKRVYKRRDMVAEDK